MKRANAQSQCYDRDALAPEPGGAPSGASNTAIRTGRERDSDDLGSRHIPCVALAAVVLCKLAPAADLLETYRQAVQGDPTLSAAGYELEADSARVGEARSALLPSLGFNGQLARTGGDAAYSGLASESRTFNSFVWTIQVSVPLLHAGDLMTEHEARIDRSISQMRYQLAQQDLILRVARAYFGVLEAQANVAAAEGERRATEEQRALARSKFDDGLIPINDYDEATARAESAAAQKYAADADIRVRRAELERISGSLEERFAELRDNAVVAMADPTDPDHWTEQALQANLKVKVAQDAAARARLETLKAKSARLPTVDGFVSYGRNFSSGDNTNFVNYASEAFPWEIGIQVSIPILDGGGIRSKISEMGARWHKAQQDLEAARRDAATDAYAAYQGVESGLAQIKALRSAIAASDRAVRGNEAGYSLGTRINSDVLNAQRQLYADQRNLAKARYDTILHGLELKAAAGDLQLHDVYSVNDLLAK
jgi:outer membrane protein